MHQRQYVIALHENRREPLDALPHITVRHEQRLDGGGIRIEE